MNVLIIEQDAIAAARLRQLLEESAVPVVVTAVLNSIDDMQAHLTQQPAPDLVLMDMELCDDFALELFRAMEKVPRVVFVTPAGNKAVKAFRYTNIDYLLKPVQRTDLEGLLQQCKRQAPITGAPAVPAMDPSAMNVKEYRSRFLVKKGTRLYSIADEHIAYFFYRGRHLYIRTFSNQDYIVDATLDEMEGQLDPRHFFRVNRQYIVRYRAVDMMSIWFDGKLKLKLLPEAGEELLVGKGRVNEFKRWMGK